jgi:hypothetical protein
MLLFKGANLKEQIDNDLRKDIYNVEFYIIGIYYKNIFTQNYRKSLILLTK